MKEKDFISYQHQAFEEPEMLQRSIAFYQEMDRRRSLRHFSDKDVPQALIENVIRTAATAPSGAHKQPYCFCVVRNKDLKKSIREAAEKEEYENYHGRMSDEWLQDLEPFETDWHKEFIETAPWLIIVFKKIYNLEKGIKSKNYYVNESVGISCGFLLAAIHHAGLVGLTHTPSPMNFLEKILKRPPNEKAFLLIPIGYPAENAEVPDIQRRALDKISAWY